MHTPSLPAAALGLALLVLPGALLAQGSLTPSGAPAASMKSLAQVEPRTPLAGSTSTVTISQPGSYYLTGNVAVSSGNGITISASNVSLDLNGFSVTSSSPSVSGTGIEISLARSNVSISNGHVQGAATYNGTSYAGGGFFDGIAAVGAFSTGLRVSGVNVNAVRNNGIDLGTDGTAVTNSIVRLAGGVGIRASSVADSSAQVTGSTSINALSASNVAGATTGAGPAVVPTPTTLAEFDPRIAIPGGSAGYTISQPGSYVLKGNLTVASGNAITVAANDVSIDLNGYTLASTANPAAGRAIDLTGSRTNVSVANGHIRGGVTYNGSFSAGPGFIGGIDWASGAPTNARVANVTVTGVTGYAIDLGTSETSAVQACVVRIAGNLGIRAGTVSDSSATLVGNTPIDATTAANCVGRLANGSLAATVANPTLQSVQAVASATQSTAATTQTAVAALQTSVNALETRTPISSAPFVINTRGSYYLTGNLSFTSGNAITINSSQVTLDLNGFTISGVSGCQAGISVAANLVNVVIRNGFIRGTVTFTSTGAGTGSFSAGGPVQGIAAGDALDVAASGVHVSGVAGLGIDLGFLGRAESCSVHTSGASGITAGLIRGCVARQSGDIGLRANVVAESVGHVVGTGNQSGIAANVVVASHGVSDGTGNGIVGEVVQNSFGLATGSAANAVGIRGAMIGQSYGSGGTGIFAPGVVHSYGAGFIGISALDLLIGSTGTGTITATNRYNMP
ncbi:MAG: hypothetical protein JSR82_06145 [Verrucomicrobia bacterium]|nr:hypothetical protein [Verrucomicrobiota bacterium]